jgi:hypothetical protein
MLINGSRRRRSPWGGPRAGSQPTAQAVRAAKVMKSFSGGMLGKKFGKMKLPFM